LNSGATRGQPWLYKKLDSCMGQVSNHEQRLHESLGHTLSANRLAQHKENLWVCIVHLVIVLKKCAVTYVVQVQSIKVSLGYTNNSSLTRLQPYKWTVSLRPSRILTVSLCLSLFCTCLTLPSRNNITMAEENSKMCSNCGAIVTHSITQCAQCYGTDFVPYYPPKK
jgi:hypothetical protein